MTVPWRYDFTVAVGSVKPSSSALGSGVCAWVNRGSGSNGNSRSAAFRPRASTLLAIFDANCLLTFTGRDSLSLVLLNEESFALWVALRVYLDDSPTDNKCPCRRVIVHDPKFGSVRPT